MVFSICAMSASAATYTVKRGDSLWKIASETLGSGLKWKEIYEANQEQIKDPNQIFVGQELKIPGEEPAPSAPSEKPEEGEPAEEPQKGSDAPEAPAELVKQAEFFRGVLPLTEKQSYNFSAYAMIDVPAEVREWSLGGANRTYNNLPDVMKFNDGSEVTSSSEDLEKRRHEMLDLLQKYVYGIIPAGGYTTTYEVVEEGTALDGAAVRKQIKITVETEKGAMDMMALLYIPSNVEKVPVIVAFSSGNHTVLADPEILKDASETRTDAEVDEERGSSADGYQVKTAISKGYGYAFISTKDIAPDSEEYGTRLVSLFDEPEFKALSAWAFGMSRLLDYCETDDAINMEQIVNFGHSRYGKAALWAAANDDRIALCLCNASGGGGIALNRANNADNISSLTKMEPWWFCSNYASYADKPDELPVDQHFVAACVAPRGLYVGNGDDDLWADPQGSWNGLLYARPMFAAYGADVIPDTYQPNEEMVAVGEHVWSGSMAFHLRNGFHAANNDDWTNYFDYMDEYLK